MKFLGSMVIALALGGCSCQPAPENDGGGPGGDGGQDAGGNQLFQYVTLESSPLFVGTGVQSLSMAVGPGDRIGVAYFVRGDGGVDGSVLLDDGGTGPAQLFANVDIKYLEWSSAGGVTQPQYITTVQEQGVRGISVAFQPGGEPTVAYFGGPNKGNLFGGGAVPGGGNPYWFQQNAMLNRRQADAVTWQETMIDDYSMNVLPNNQGNTATCLYNGMGPDNNNLAMILGIYPSLAIDAQGNSYLAYRDVHQAQFPIQDWQGSGLKLAKVPTSWQSPVATGSFCATQPTTGQCQGIAWGGSNHGALPGFGGFGGHNDLVLGANGLPALVSDQVQGSASGLGNNVLFFQGTTTAHWSCSNPAQSCANVMPPTPWSPVFCMGNQLIASDRNTDTGPSLAWDDPADGGLGYGIAFVDGNSNQLFFTESADGTAFGAPDPGPLGQGVGGLNPSLAIDPIAHEPHIAYYMCTGNLAPPCANPSATDFNGSNIQIVQRVAGGAGGWVPVIVDKDGASNPKLSFLSTGKRAVVYQITDGSLRLALERGP